MPVHGDKSLFVDEKGQELIAVDDSSSDLTLDSAWMRDEELHFCKVGIIHSTNDITALTHGVCLSVSHNSKNIPGLKLLFHCIKFWIWQGSSQQCFSPFA